MDFVSYILSLRSNYSVTMKKFFILIKETMQYMGIILITLLSALWLYLRKLTGHDKPHEPEKQ